MNTKALFVVFAFVFVGTSKASDPKEGKTIFMSRCAACHNVNKTLTGPALAGVDQRRTIDWIINFVHSSQTMVKEGDKDAVALFQQFKVPMPDHPDLTDEQIVNIVEYIKEEGKLAETKNTTPVIQKGTNPGNPLSSLTRNPLLFTFLLLSAAGLAGTVLFALRVKAWKNQWQKAKEIA
jgi:mono/diheme cytochrome c family protein